MNEVAKMERHEAEAHQIADPMVSMIERVVMNPDADLEKLERMLVMKERIDAQNARVAFAGALSAARAEIPPIVKDATVDFSSAKGRTHYKHETLAGIAKAIDPILARHGISYRFRTTQENGGVRVSCIIAHAAGHSEETSLSCAPDSSGNKNSFQAVGSAVTYLQRYTLKAALGLSAEVDDDGHNADPRHDDRQQRHAQDQRQQQGNPPAADQMERDMMAALQKYGADAMASDPRFRTDFKLVKSQNPEAAGRIEAEINRLKAAANPPASSGITDDEIPY